MKLLFTIAAVAIITMPGCFLQKMPLDTVYDLPPNIFPLKVLNITSWSKGKNLYTFEDNNHNNIVKVYTADPNLKVGTAINYKDVK